MSFCGSCQSGLNTLNTEYTDVLQRCGKNKVGACLACNQLSELEKKIFGARKVLQDLLEERKQMSSVLNQCHDPLTTRVPVEIASRIFLQIPTFRRHTFGSNRRDEHDRLAYCRSVILPGQICRRWRDIAQGTPELWTELWARLQPGYPPHPPPYNDILGRWLGQFYALPLSLDLNISQRVESHFVTEEMFEAIIPHFSRCRVLDISFPSLLLPSISNALSSTSFPQIKHLLLDSFSSNHAHRDVAVLRLNAAPKTLTQRHILLRQVSIDFSQLTYVKGQGAYVSECVTLFRNAHRLVSFDFGRITDDEQPSSLDSVVECESLQNLRIKNCEAQDFFRILSFPSLKALDFDFDGAGSYDWDVMKDFFKRSGGQIEDLDMARYIGQNDARSLVEVLGHLPSLRDLTVYVVDEDEQILAEPLLCVPQLTNLAVIVTSTRPHRLFSFATGSSGSTVERLLPRLASLCYMTTPEEQDCMHLICDLSQLVIFLETRSRSATPLQLEISHHDADMTHITELWSKERLQRILEMLRDLGIEFQLTQSYRDDNKEHDLKDRLLRQYGLSIAP